MESIVIKISIMLVPALLAIILHEVSHGYVAERFGDPTARLLGRLNLNPLRHLDPIGTLAVFIFGFGWARPVPVNAGNMRHPKRDMIWVAIAGPLTNLSLAALSAFLLKGISLIEPMLAANNDLFIQVSKPLRMMAAFSLYINVLLGSFNLLPIPPLDGGRVLIGILPERQAALISKLEPFGFVLILFLVFFTDLWKLVLSPVITGIIQWLAGDEWELVQQSMQLLFGS
ncbi:MAG TPA: site-2 protease family protein [Geopsychrobacteraceae bacterium]|nr:site-2 protease family protein [Geopsychrobacteraceae bacterium]